MVYDDFCGKKKKKIVVSFTNSFLHRGFESIIV